MPQVPSGLVEMEIQRAPFANVLRVPPEAEPEPEAEAEPEPELSWDWQLEPQQMADPSSRMATHLWV
jgi:hypothetical protein